MKRVLKSVAVSYDLQENLGEGLNSVVYKARRSDPYRRLHQTVALKILKSRNMVDVWKNEFASLERIQHRNCVRVFGFDWIEGRPALILEYVQGVSLRQLCLHGPLPRPWAFEILAQVQAGLNSMKEHGVCHGDLSPNNVMIDFSGCVKILDFGWCSGRGSVRATPDFAAPELLTGSAPGFASDLYSIGALEKLLLQTESPRLNLNPQLRPPITAPPNPRRQLSLGRHVKGLVEHRARLKNLATQSLHRPRSARPFLTMALTFSLLLAAPPSQSSGTPPIESVLRIRTWRWAQIQVDGKDIGFAPRDLVLGSQRVHQIEWRTPEGHGAVRVRLKPGETRFLRDADLEIFATAAKKD